MSSEKTHTIVEVMPASISSEMLSLSFLCLEGEIVTLKMNDTQLSEITEVLTKELTRVLIYREYGAHQSQLNNADVQKARVIPLTSGRIKTD